MKSALLELMICGTVGTYCVMRCASLVPAAFAEARAVVAAAFDRQRRIEEVLEPKGE
jgi:hypothetical protein